MKDDFELVRGSGNVFRRMHFRNESIKKPLIPTLIG